MRNHDGIRRCEFLQARRQVRRFAGDRRFLGGAFADDVADNNRACRDADPHLQGAAFQTRRRNRANGPCKTEPGAECPFRIVLVPARPAEVSQNAIAHEFGHITVIPGDDAGADVLVGRASFRGNPQDPGASKVRSIRPDRKT